MDRNVAEYCNICLLTSGPIWLRYYVKAKEKVNDLNVNDERTRANFI